MHEFEWDITKAESNITKHGVSFDEAKTVFGDFGLMYASDPDHSEYEAREIAIGYSSQGRLLTVCFTERGEHIRIISARRSTNPERKRYGDD
jgi:uncharacterized DUF497 family protein